MFAYTTKVTYEKKRMGHLECGNGFVTKFSAPPEFGGFQGFATPEDLFVASVNTCLLLTFESICKKMGITFHSFECHCTGVLETIEGKEVFTKVVLKPRVRGDDQGKIKKALQLAEKYCLITNSINCKVVLDLDDIR
jgi:organic hydroperoxide reductase OsmC/OhrA